MSQVEPPPPRITRRLVFAVVAAEAGLTPEDLMGRSRKRPIMEARRIAMHLAATMTSSALVSIGRDLGGREFTSVLLAREKIKEQEASNAALRARLEGLRAEILKQARQSQTG